MVLCLYCRALYNCISKHSIQTYLKNDPLALDIPTLRNPTRSTVAYPSNQMKKSTFLLKFLENRKSCLKLLLNHEWIYCTNLAIRKNGLMHEGFNATTALRILQRKKRPWRTNLKLATAQKLFCFFPFRLSNPCRKTKTVGCSCTMHKNPKIQPQNDFRV